MKSLIFIHRKAEEYIIIYCSPAEPYFHRQIYSYFNKLLNGFVTILLNIDSCSTLMSIIFISKAFSKIRSYLHVGMRLMLENKIVLVSTMNRRAICIKEHI